MVDTEAAGNIARQAQPTMTTTELLSKIAADIEANRTIYVGTTMRVTSFSPKTVAKIRATGVEPFKIGSDGSLRMLEGWAKGKARYVCITLSNGSPLVSIQAQ